MLIQAAESLSNKYFIGEPHLIMKNGEWEKVVSEQEYTQGASPDSFTSFAVVKSKNDELSTSLFCLKTKKTVSGKISNANCLLAVIPESFWDKTKINNAAQHGFFIETNGKTYPKLNPNKKHISVCYTGNDNKIYTYTILTQLAKLKIEKIVREEIEKHNPSAIKNTNVFETKKTPEKETFKKHKAVKEAPKFYDKFKVKKY
ncbi:MAG: hypothetical protein AB7E39_06785 [Endomicrobiaceae bacterium]